MVYLDGTEIRLNDVVSVSVPEGYAFARVVMLGETYEHSAIGARFVEWVKQDRILESTSIVIEWLNENPFAHNDPKYAPVGNYMFTGVESGLHFVSREHA